MPETRFKAREKSRKQSLSDNDFLIEQSKVPRKELPPLNEKKKNMRKSKANQKHNGHYLLKKMIH